MGGIAAGRLRQRVTIEDLVKTQDTDGAIEEDWQALFGGRLLPAEKLPLSGSELLAAAAVQSKVTTRFRLRFREGVRARMRVDHRGEKFNIEAVVPDQDSGITFMTLHCTSGVSEG